MSAPEHLFAQYLRILGKGKNTSRSLTRDEAFVAFTHILNEEVEDIQLGAFLLLLRVKGEDEQEMAGFAESAQQFINAPETHADIDWPTYAGKHKQQLWYLLSALLLAENGHKIFMHGTNHVSATRVHTAKILPELNIRPCNNWNDIENNLAQDNFSYASLDVICPSLNRLFSYRRLLGVRSPVNSFIKLVNPLKTETTLQSVFHPAYLEIHQKAALLLDHPHSLVLKGEGGEIEFRPDAENRLFLLNHRSCTVEKWPRTQPKRQPDLELENISGDTLKAIWSGSINDDYGMNAILGTTAMVLFARRLANNQQEAWQTALNYWSQRDKKRFIQAF